MIEGKGRDLLNTHEALTLALQDIRLVALCDIISTCYLPMMVGDED